MADDILKRYGALVSISDLTGYFGLSWTIVAKRLAKCSTYGRNTGKRYFYLDVVEAFCSE